MSKEKKPRRVKNPATSRRQIEATQAGPSEEVDPGSRQGQRRKERRSAHVAEKARKRPWSFHILRQMANQENT